MVIIIKFKKRKRKNMPNVVFVNDKSHCPPGFVYKRPIMRMDGMVRYECRKETLLTLLELDDDFYDDDLDELLVRPSSKQIWPELLGEDANAAKEIILKEQGVRSAPIVRKGSPITYDLRFSRVRIFVDENGKVASIPNRG